MVQACRGVKVLVLGRESGTLLSKSISKVPSYDSNIFSGGKLRLAGDH